MDSKGIEWPVDERGGGIWWANEWFKECGMDSVSSTVSASCCANVSAIPPVCVGGWYVCVRIYVCVQNTHTQTRYAQV